mgnify:FL=1
MFHAELVKLKRSSVWVIAAILPLLAVTLGTINLANNRDVLDSGWESFTSQVVLFYGMLFSSLGVALLASSVWRTEHRGTNWNLLLTTTLRPSRLVAAKAGVIAVVVAFMQLVLVVSTFTSGVLVLDLDGALPWQFAIVAALAVVAALPLIAAQSLISMLLKSFAAPVAICLLGSVIGIATITSATLRPFSAVIPQAINTRALTLGSTASLAESGGLTSGDVAPLLGTAVILAVALLLTTVAAIRTIKLR